MLKIQTHGMVGNILSIFKAGKLKWVKNIVEDVGTESASVEDAK